MTDKQRDLTPILEALFVTAGRPLSFRDLETLLPEFDSGDVRLAVSALRGQYREGNRGLELAEVAGGFRLQVPETLAPWVKRLKRVTPVRLSRAALETLAVILHKQPVTRAEIEQVRGVDTSGTLRFLMDHRLIRVCGKKEVPGRPLLYRTSRRFLEVFGLKDLKTISQLLQEPETSPQRNLFDQAG